ncbi:YidB family protein [Acinetobacter puyangensis]|uniref:Uncharacterized conserved protein YidB, DUF937 family n=1 Tax=Acinetobacter puyangensis TaxID=1096779 RepID=A0A240E5V7_9GAMM|nr:YidB family protein [Acinetobacter puyangensis]SNX43972.1 Uncharacterized conserved protein YidB, DUF937 family [Acinetobacter puyangensis]
MSNLSDLVEVLAKQALGGQSNQQNQSQPSGSGLGGILGSVLGQVINQGNNQSSNTNNSNASSQSGLGGILGSVLGQLGQQGGRSNTAASGGGTSALLVAVLPIILAWIQKQGGLQGALSKLQQAGLGGQVQSWVSPEAPENAPIPQQQVQQLFDEQDVVKVAEETNVPTQNIYAAIAAALPQVIDSLTPKGEQSNQQEADSDIQNVLNLVSGFLKK